MAAGRLASLPMYPAPDSVLEAFWRGLRRHLTRAGVQHAPEALIDGQDAGTHWLSTDLLLSQTCGFPLTSTLKGQVRYVGTPCYAAPGCRGAMYSSALVVRADDPASSLADLRGRRVAFNSRDSQSGFNAVRALAAPLAENGRFFAEAIETGAHRRSASAVKGGAADLASVDAVTLALLHRHQAEEAQGLRVLGFTASAPGLPLITALGTSDAEIGRIRTAWQAALADPVLAECRAAMLLTGFEVLSPADYAVIPAMQDQAIALGYSDLR